MVFISALVTNNGAPASGIGGGFPVVNAWRLDNDAQVLNNQLMSEVGSSGIYKYDWTLFDPLLTYHIVVDAGPTIPAAERYVDIPNIVPLSRLNSDGLLPSAQALIQALILSDANPFPGALIQETRDRIG